MMLALAQATPGRADSGTYRTAHNDARKHEVHGSLFASPFELSIDKVENYYPRRTNDLTDRRFRFQPGHVSAMR